MAANSTTSKVARSCLIASTFDISNTTSLPDQVRPMWIFLGFVNSIVAPPTFVINSLVILTVVKNVELRSVKYNILLAVLALTDLLMAVVDILFVAYLVYLLKNYVFSCQIFSALVISAIILAVLTACTLSMLSVERYLAVEYPLFFQAHVTWQKMVVITAIVWVSVPTAALLTRMLAKDLTVQRIPLVIIAALNVIIIIFCNIKVQLTVHRQRIAIAQEQIQRAHLQQKNHQNQYQENHQNQFQENHQNQFQENHQNQYQENLQNQYQENHQNQYQENHQNQYQENQQNQFQENHQNQFQENKRNFTLLLLVISSIIAYCPIIISVTIESMGGKDVTDDFKYLSQPLYVSFVHLQSLVNPLIMSLRLSYIREGVKNKLFCRQ